MKLTNMRQWYCPVCKMKYTEFLSYLKREANETFPSFYECLHCHNPCEFVSQEDVKSN